MAAHAGNSAILHRLLGAIFGSCAGAIEARPPQDLRHQADEGRPRRGGKNGGRDQEPLRAAVSGLTSTLMVRRRASAVSNQEATMRAHPSRRGEDAAPQDEGEFELADTMTIVGN